MSKIEFFGTYGHERYRNVFNGFTAFSVNAANPQKVRAICPKLGKHIPCTGIIPEYRFGTPVQVEGEIEETKYGTQVRIEKIREYTWGIACTASYLTNICAGIGDATALAIASMYPDIFDFVKDKDAAQTLAAHSTLSIETCLRLCDTVRDTCAQREVYELVAPYGVPWATAYKISQKHGLLAAKMLKEDPYSIGMENGMDFYACDRFAKATDKDAVDPTRIKQAIIKAFEQEQSSGHVYSTAADICRGAQAAIRKSAFNEKVPSSVFMDALSADNDIVIENCEGVESVYRKYLYNDECGVAYQLGRLKVHSKPLPFNENIVWEMERECGITYAAQQAACFQLLDHSGVKVITGGPGTGKTTTVNGVIKAYERLNPGHIIRLCAPTGRAAQRMTESTGREAVTIHRLLEYRPYGDNEVSHKNKDNPILADLIVVDEASMLDISLAHLFLAAVKDGATVLFVGDIDQLPSVGAGDFLHDILGVKGINNVKLTTVYRQGQQSPIIQNAYAINNGVNTLIDNDEYRTIVCESAEEMAEQAMLMTVKSYDNDNPFDTQILCPTHKGDAGVVALNTLLQNTLNPTSPLKKEMKYGLKTFRVYDKVILTNNNYVAGYFNGDIGVITDISEAGVHVSIAGKELVITKANLDDLTLAYAMTIHKSQGSEFKNIIVVMPKSPSNMLKRNLLYTAVTRAKKTVKVLTEGDAAITAIETVETGTRNTHLRVRLAVGEAIATNEKIEQDRLKTRKEN